MTAVAGFGERCLRDIEKTHTLTWRPPGHALDDLCNERTTRAPQLRRELESFLGRKRARRHVMELDEQVVGALPCNEFFVRERHAALTGKHRSTYPPYPSHSSHLSYLSYLSYLSLPVLPTRP